jgi:hypothetical protein
MNSKEQIRVILQAGREAERPIVSKIQHWQSETERLQADLTRQQMRGLSTRATGAAAAVLIEVIKEEREAFRQSLKEPGPQPVPEEIEQACEAALAALQSIETSADATREQLLR